MACHYKNFIWEHKIYYCTCKSICLISHQRTDPTVEYSLKNGAAVKQLPLAIRTKIHSFTLCLKFELTLKKMLRRFRRHQNLNFEISYWFSKYFWNWTTSSWENSVFAKIYLITNQTFKDIGTLKKCSRTFDGISKIVWS